MDHDHVCSACRVAEQFEELSPEFWEARERKFGKLINKIVKNNTSGYDCIVPVSGGKDSYYQAHLITEKYGMKPLLVTYHGNNYLPEGDYNRDRMREVFDADHIVYGPSVDVLKKLNKLCFKRMGDMNWHAHCGIFTVPIIVAAKFKIPLILWGETAWDISGMHDPDDFVEFSNRVRHEHGLRGYEWYDLINDEEYPLTEKDMNWAKYPSDQEILEAGIRGLYVGNFFKWKPYRQTEIVKEKYGWKESEKEFERTYRKISNLDDRYENGIHDYLKFVKFGYGRASDHASKDIRTGHMTREQGIEMVKKYDHVLSSDLDYWLDYVDMDKEEFMRVSDTFRDPRVWWIENGQWYKNNVWGGSSAYGEVYLSKEEQEKFKR